MKKVLSVATFLFVAIIASASLSHTGSDGGACFDECPVGAIWFEHAL